MSRTFSDGLVWYRDEADPGYQALARCEQWEVVLPELVFGSMS